MNMYEIITKKKRGGKLTEAEIEFFVNGFTCGEIPDYQASALLMAICINGMDDEETGFLTAAMRDSGDKTDLSCFGGRAVDKHSTGGVGDKTSLVVLPIVASLGCVAAKMSGRGLGHTGGTVDKLESISGYKTELSAEEFMKIASETGIALVGQSGNFAPADKKLYALRDVTATVDSIPLIASSIMSKKLAAGADVIVLDVKTGSGAFMKTEAEARLLAEKMVSIGESCGKKCAAVISDMDVPLGRAVGNALEVKEALRLLKYAGKPEQISDINDLKELCLELSSNIVALCFNKTTEAARDECIQSLESGAAFRTFCRWIKAQGGDLSFTENPEDFCKAAFSHEVKAPCSGRIMHMDSELVGRAASSIGAGRICKEDTIDFPPVLCLKRRRVSMCAGVKLWPCCIHL